mgnify:CR=1 FL=1
MSGNRPEPVPARLRAPRASGVGTDQLRKHNLSAILTLLHHGGAQARSALTAQTGLNRSTVAALVAELEERGLAYETEPDPTKQVGRPSPRVNADERNLAIAINPEVDAITVALVALGGRVVERMRHDTDRVPSAPEAVAIATGMIEQLTGELPGDHRVLGAGFAVPGLVRADDGLVRLAPHLEWIDQPVAAMLAEATGLHVVAGNDASLGALVEHIYGAGRGYDEMIYLNGGPSGIGGGVITHGGLLGGASGYAGEFGHTRAGGGATLESVVRRVDLLKAVGRTAAAPDELEELVLASTDRRVAQVVRKQLTLLGAALGDAVNILNPQRVVLGGFLGTILMRDPEFLRAQVAAGALAAEHEDVEIVAAALGSDLLLVGAAEIVFARLLADPASHGRLIPNS